MNKIIFFVLMLYLKRVMLDPCEIHRTCRDCIRDATVCDWCASDVQMEYRCKSKSFTSTNATWCPDSLERLRGSINPTKDVSFSSQPGNIIQIKPQSYQIYLRPGVPQKFNFAFKLSENYPVDMYFLFHSSAMMDKFRKHTEQLSKHLYDTMIDLTKDVFIGMGTFVDKNMLPFTINVMKNESYSFRHHLNLTNDYTEFQKAIEEIKRGENQDSPEAGLDALAQAIVCKNVIGWRNESRKILVLMTDALYHTAGDGRSAGLFKPYDGKCYTEGNVYTKEQEMDYPSVTMINKVVRENDVIVIFAVTLTDVYSGLVDFVSGSKMIKLNYYRTDDIVNKLKGIYEDRTTDIKLNVKTGTDASGSTRQKDFQIAFDPDCPKDHKDSNVPGISPKKITGTIQMLEYRGYDRATVDVSIEGIAEKLTLDVNIINTCGCEKSAEDKSPLCDKEKRECGVCVGKKPKFTGPYCECSVSNCPSANHSKCQCDGTCKCDNKCPGNACQSKEELCVIPAANTDLHVEYRCKSKNFTSTNATWCRCPDSLERLRGSIKPTKDVTFSSQPGNVTQIKPQSYHIYLMPGEPQKFNFAFKLAKNYPIDMYFLFDSSGTMKPFKKHTAQLSKHFYDTMIDLTKDVYIGMGTFVDKNMLPFTINVMKNESYSFRHHLNLTNDYTEFQKAIEEIKMGINRDSPEAGLDALAQAIVCKNVIGWRNESRKILVLMTDAPYHAAGDGRSAGLFKPYDGKCYTEGNVYTKEQEMDYPSVAMINKLARENDVIVIFAVSLTDVYSRLVDVVSGSKMIYLNDYRTDDIVKKLKGLYEDIITKIKLNVNIGTDARGSTHRKNLQISFDPDCTKGHEDCNVQGFGSKFFTGTIQILEYGGYDKATIDVFIEGIAEKLALDINIINTCGCQKIAEDDSLTSLCDKEKRECGVCVCKEPNSATAMEVTTATPVLATI